MRARFPRLLVLLSLAIASAGSAQAPGQTAPAPSPGGAPTPPVVQAPLATQAVSEDWRARLDGIEALIGAAHFKEALEGVDQARGRLGQAGVAAPSPLQRARLDVLEGTAEVALGLHREARESFARALVAEPGLQLPPDTSPKVQRAFSAARKMP